MRMTPALAVAILVVPALVAALACQASPPLIGGVAGAARGTAAAESPAARDEPDRARARMVATQIAARGIEDARVLDAMGEVPRHRFVPASLADHAYEDRPLPIGHDQTISQPYIVALMTELSRPDPGARALEIGTGSGYQAAVLSRLVSHVYSIELVEPLATAAAERLRTLGYENVTVRAGDGYRGWPDQAPFDVILVTAAPDEVPPALVEQLAPGGRMVVPVGPQSAVQELRLIEKGRDGRVSARDVLPVRFVPMRKSG
jgi:protein-L-isoaspartate(D-aspartate) O-methyltransferase